MDLAARDLKRRITKVATALIVGSLILSAAIIAALLSSGFALFAVSGLSMDPSIQDGNTIIIQNEDSLRSDQIAILKKPDKWLHVTTRDTLLVKRVMAVPGDTLSFDGHSFLVNGVSVYDLDTIGYECKSGMIGYEHTLSDQEVFVMGDNPNASLDSRRIFCEGRLEDSFVPYENLINHGKIIMKF